MINSFFKLEAKDLEIIDKLSLKAPSTWIATWCGLGFINPGPGTWGSLGALPFGLLIYGIFGVTGLALATILIAWIGYWATYKFEKATGVHDSKMVVVDEVAGQWLVLLASSFSFLSVMAAFLLFRFFDILKPWPISWLERRIPGPAGVMGDDLMAGIYAIICLTGLHYAGLG